MPTGISKAITNCYNVHGRGPMPATLMTNVTQILSEIESGDPAAAERLLPLIYDELRRLAASKLRHEKPGHTLQATALVHEAYMRLVQPQNGVKWNSRGHFFAAAAEAMRRVLVDAARRKACAKNGGHLDRIELNHDQVTAPQSRLDLLALSDALDDLSTVNPRLTELVKLRFFGGLTVEQAAEALTVSTSTAEADWAYAKAWLRVRLRD